MVGASSPSPQAGSERLAWKVGHQAASSWPGNRPKETDRKEEKKKAEKAFVAGRQAENSSLTPLSLYASVPLCGSTASPAFPYPPHQQAGRGVLLLEAETGEQAGTGTWTGLGADCGGQLIKLLPPSIHLHAPRTFSPAPPL